MEAGSEYTVGPFLARLRTEVSSAEDAWKQVTVQRQGETAEVRLLSSLERATPVGLMLYKLDLEVRRAMEIVRNEFSAPPKDQTVWRTFRPMRVRDGGLALAGAEIGSVDLLLVGFGAVGHVLLSDPVQLALTVKELLGLGRRCVVSVKGRLDPAPREVWRTEDSRIEAPEAVSREATPGRIRIRTDLPGVSVEDVPPDTRIRFKHVAIDGTETTIEIERD
jgi:hypothetical protein